MKKENLLKTTHVISIPNINGITQTNWISKEQEIAWEQSAKDYVLSRVGDIEICENMFVDMSSKSKI